MAIPNLPITVSQFSRDKNLLNLELWAKQEEILEEFWNGNYSIGVWALGRRSGKTLMSAVIASYAHSAHFFLLAPASTLEL